MHRTQQNVASTASGTILCIRDLERTRPTAPLYTFSIADLSLHQGGRYSLLGASGSGKSTAMDVFSMILRPDKASEFTLTAGQERIDVATAWRNGDLDALARYRSQYLGYVLQTGGLMPFLSIRENILLTRQVKGLPGDGPLASLAQQLGIGHLMDKKAGAVSVGERQRAGIARALIHEPSLVLADEPTAALDPYAAAEVLELLVALSEEQGVTLLVATHDWQRIRALKFTELCIHVDKTDTAIQAVLAESTREV